MQLQNSLEEQPVESANLDFLKGHIAATMTLVQALIDQGAVNGVAMDKYFEQFLAELPHTRQTLTLRIILNQWREGLRNDEHSASMRRSIFEVVEGGNNAAE